MTRVFPAHTYGPRPREKCYWATTTEAVPRDTAKGTIKADVAIIGAGFTGLSAALHLAQDGADVVVLEAEHIGWGASGRNGGFCCLGGSAASDQILAGFYGEAARQDFRKIEIEAVNLATSLIKDHDIPADVHSKGETLMAHTQKAFDGFEKLAGKVEDDFGVTPTILARSALAQNGMDGPFFGAITTPIGFALNPVKYAGGLARATSLAGVRIFENSPVNHIEQSADYTLSTPEAQVTCKRLIIATNGYSSDNLPPWMRARYLPTQSNVLVTREMSEDEIATQGWSTNQMCYDDRYFLHYFRLMPNRRMLFGMRGGLFSANWADRRMHHNIRKHFERMFPAWAHVETPHSWNGLLSISRDLTPYAGPIPEMPGAFTALSFHGNGVAMGTYAGALLADLVQGKTPSRPYGTILSTPPKKFPLGRFRRACIWPVYAAAVLSGS